MIHPCDRQTDGRAIAYTRYSIYAVARKNQQNIEPSQAGDKFTPWYKQDLSVSSIKWMTLKVTHSQEVTFFIQNW